MLLYLHYTHASNLTPCTHAHACVMSWLSTKTAEPLSLLKWLWWWCTDWQRTKDRGVSSLQLWVVGIDIDGIGHTTQYCLILLYKYHCLFAERPGAGITLSRRFGSRSQSFHAKIIFFSFPSADNFLVTTPCLSLVMVKWWYAIIPSSLWKWGLRNLSQLYVCTKMLLSSVPNGFKCKQV